eukprot:RCo011552
MKTPSLVSSGVLELSMFALLGWLLAAFHIRSGGQDPDQGLAGTSVGPFVSYRKVVQAHIDGILMGIIQMLIGSVLAPYITGTTSALLIAGSWANPCLFLVPAVSPSAPKKTWMKGLSTLSFLTTSAAYIRLCESYFLSGPR